jgi:signal transduction histidine kinase
MVRQPIGLRTRITLVFGALALSVSTTLAVGTYLTARHYLVAQREHAATRQAFVDASFVREGLLTSGAQVDDVLASTSPPPGAVLVLHRRESWYSSFLGADREVVPTRLREAVAGGAAASTWARLDGQPAVVVGTPLTAVGAELFEVTPATELSSTLDTLRMALAGFALLTTAGGAAIGRAAARRVVAPLDGIAMASARIAGGDIRARLGSTRDPDLSVIVGSFNAMVEALQERLNRDARFAADVAHELRSPLTAMTTTVDVLEQAPDARHREQSVRLLRREVDRLGHALEQLLALGRLDAGVDDAPRALVDLAELVENTLSLTHRSPKLLRGPADPVRVNADKAALLRSVTNLLDNADVHGGGVVRVEVGLQHGWAAVAVDDAGPGVPTGERQRIFERFARSGSRAARPGTGLGLSLVSETLRAHGGDVICGDSPEGGARFVLRLPSAGDAQDSSIAVSGDGAP